MLGVPAAVLFGLDERTLLPEQLDHVCLAIPWLTTLAFSIAFASLFAKVYRVVRIFTSTTLMSIPLPDGLLARAIAVIVLPNLIVLAVWSGADAPHWRVEELLRDGDG